MLSLLTRALSGRHLPVPAGRGIATKVAALAAVPALLLGTGSAAVAASNTLTLTAFDRSGAKVSILATAVNLASSESYPIRAGKTRKLPKGTYGVLISIATGDTTTLGGTTVKVSGASKVTLDARKGKLLTLALNPTPVGLSSSVTARVCTKTSVKYEVEAYASENNPVYVIPTASKSLALAALGSWGDGSGVTDSYAVLHTTTGVSSNPSKTFSQASLGTVTVVSRRGPSGSNSSDVAVQPVGRGCGDYLFAGLWNADRPTRAKINLSPGKWDIRTDSSATTNDGSWRNIGGWTAKREVVAGKSYSVRFFGAAWGPGTQLPVVLNGRLSFGLEEMFQDPAFISGGSYGYEGGDKSTATLVFGGKTVKTAKDNGWGYLPSLVYTVKKAGWYTLTNTASRYYPEITFPTGMLSTRTIVSYRLYAKPNSYALASAYSVQLVPAGLNGYNQAAPGSTTSVALRLHRYSQDPDAKRGTNPTVKKVTAKVSADGGKTWFAAPVKKVNGVWTAMIDNPASGTVSIRTRATYTNNGFTEVTIFRAYAIS